MTYVFYDKRNFVTRNLCISTQRRFIIQSNFLFFFRILFLNHDVSLPLVSHRCPHLIHVHRWSLRPRNVVPPLPPWKLGSANSINSHRSRDSCTQFEGDTNVLFGKPVSRRLIEGKKREEAGISTRL